nr:laccase-1-like [Osmia lignaria]
MRRIMCFRFPATSQYFRVYILFLVLLVHTELSYCHREFWGPREDIVLSSPEECARNCKDNEERKNCYYKFHIEFYTTLGAACDEKNQTQCIIADGFEKTLIPINRQLPGPPIQVCVNDRIIVDIENAAGGMEVVMHWHGLYQNGYQYYDGVPFVTQCPIPSSTTFRYDFVAQNAGTHFYHSHISTHMLDGQVGPLIIRPPPCNEPFADLYDTDENIIFLMDWMHALSMERFPGFYRQNLGQSAENILINGLGNWTDPITKQTTNGKLAVFTVEKGKRHRMRMINSFTTVCLAELTIEGHDMLIIAQDGANVKPKTVNSIISSAGERVDFILNANRRLNSYWIQVRGLGECAEKSVQQLAILQYAGGPSKPSSTPPTYNTVPSGVVYNSLDGTKCNTKDTTTTLCVNQLESLEAESELLKVVPDERHVLNFWFFNYTQYGNNMLFKADTYRTFFAANDKSQLASMFNDIEYEVSSSPLLSQPRSSYQTVCKHNQLSTCTQPCTCTQVIHSKLNNVIELIIYDEVPLTDLHHPFHLHGYEFRVFSIGQFADMRNISKADIDQIIDQHTERLQRGEYTNPPGKDTVKIPTGGYVILRFKANNPGYWLLHCHFTWHHLTGMELVIHVGDLEDLPPVPPDFPECNNWKPPLHTLNEFYGFRYPQF